MSGGSYNYAYTRFDDFAHELAKNARTPERKAFLSLVSKVAKAAKEIEWVDSGDTSPGDENEAIREALGENHKELCMDALVEEAGDLIKELQRYVTNHRS